MIRPTPLLVERFAQHHRRSRRLGILFGLLVWSGFHLWDVALHAELPVFPQLRFIRLGVGAPLIALLWLASFAPQLRRDWQMSALAGAAVWVAWLCLLRMLQLNPAPEGIDRYLPGLLTVMLFHFTMFRHRWWVALLIALPLPLAFHVAVTHLGPTLPPDPLDYVRNVSAHAYFFSLIVIGTLLSYELEQGFYTAELQRAEIERRNQELEQAREQERLARERAEAAFAERTAFLMEASHDLRQPMQSIEIFVSLLRNAALPPPHGLTVERLGRAVRAMDHLFRGMLDLNRIDAGAVQPRPVPTFLPALLEDEIAQAAALADEKRLQLRLRVQQALWVQTDPQLLRRMLSNLLSNALRYTHRGGALVVLRRHAGQAEIRIFDTGGGIAEADRERIFKPFVRLQPGVGRAKRGLGLGLAIVRGLAQTLGVAVTLRSRLGRGSTFTLRLPLLRGAVVASGLPLPPPAEPALAAPARRARVAVVDDDPQIVQALGELLQAAGYSVLQARSGAELLATIEQSAHAAPDLLLADVELDAGETGWQVAERLRSQLGLQPALLLMTGSVNPAYRQRALAQGQELLQKPVPVAELLHAVQAALAARAEPAPPAAPAGYSSGSTDR